jgi:type IV pilus assembly protein PilA
MGNPTSYDVKRMWSRVRERRRNQRGFSLIELLIVIAIILIILSFALPKMSKSQMHTRETGAIVTLRTINTAQIQYQSQFGQYATSLAQLGPPAGAGSAEGAQAANLIPGNLAGGSTGGYNFTLTQTPSGYAATAVPKAFDNTGRRSFYTDQTGVIRESTTQEPATVNSPEIK